MESKKGMDKVGKVMDEFKKGTSKKGADVSSKNKKMMRMHERMKNA